jgi:BirA family biotin operon repressor/biotin-[acetyl-CoA-carboxylase] ligase
MRPAFYTELHRLDSSLIARHYYSQLDSTQDEAIRLLEAGSALPLLVVADSQTGGRGRHGRQWLSPAGNLYCSLLLKPPVDLSRLPELSFIAALSLHAALSALGARELRLKWPNDVLCDGKKIAGILLESAPQQTIVIGIGVNLVSHPAQAVFPATDLLAASGVKVQPIDAIERLLEEFAGLYDAWLRFGFEPLRQAWLGQAAFLGQNIQLRDPSGAGAGPSGVFVGLASDGALLLQTADGEVKNIFSGQLVAAS